MADTIVEWRIDAANSLAVRAVCYAWIGTLGGIALAVLASVGVGVLAAAGAGDLASVAFVALLVLVGGPVSLLYVLPAIRDSDYRPPLSLFLPDPADDPEETTAERYAAVFTLPRLLAAAVVGAVVVSGFTTWGRIDATEPRLEYRTGTVPIAGITNSRRFDLGGTVCYWVSYRSGERTFSTPSLLVFTPEAARLFEDVLEDVEPTDRPDPEPRNWPVTIVAGGMGLSFLAFAVGLLAVDTVPLEVGAYMAVVTGMLGVLFLWAAYALT